LLVQTLFSDLSVYGYILIGGGCRSTKRVHQPTKRRRKAELLEHHFIQSDFHCVSVSFLILTKGGFTSVYDVKQTPPKTNKKKEKKKVNQTKRYVYTCLLRGVFTQMTIHTGLFARELYQQKKHEMRAQSNGSRCVHNQTDRDACTIKRIEMRAQSNGSSNTDCSCAKINVQQATSVSLDQI